MSAPCAQPLWSQQRGDGPPILLIHGLGASAHYWDEVMAATADRRVIAPDLLGFGRSPSPPGASYDVACHLAALEPLLVPGTVVVGHSTGGILAAALAALRPDAVRHLLLVGLPAFPDAATARAEVGRLGAVARLTVEERRLGQWLCIAMCRFRPIAVAAAPLLLRGIPRAVAADGARHTWLSYSRTLRHVVVEHPVWPDLAESRVPVTFLHGRQDRTAPLRFVEALADRLHRVRQSVSVRTADGDHHIPVRRPTLVAELLADVSAPP
jgi:pimeloyl-ACP methyl ester carboxylesterase